MCGIDSVPADIIAWVLVDHIRRNLSCGVSEIINSLQDVSGAPSGGTLLTVFTILDSYPLSELRDSLSPFALSPIPKPSNTNAVTGSSHLGTMLTGTRTIPDLGVLTDSPQGTTDTVVVHRSWGLFDGGKYYGERFVFSEWLRARNIFQGAVFHYGLALFMLGMVLPPFRWLLKKWVTQPGDGPDREKSEFDRFGYKAIGTADCSPPKRAAAVFEYTGPGYYLTGLLMVEAALVILRGEEEGGTKSLAHKLGGGILTPATLEAQYVDNLKEAGVKLDVEILQY